METLFCKAEIFFKWMAFAVNGYGNASLHIWMQTCTTWVTYVTRHIIEHSFLCTNGCQKLALTYKKKVQSLPQGTCNLNFSNWEFQQLGQEEKGMARVLKNADPFNKLISLIHSHTGNAFFYNQCLLWHIQVLAQMRESILSLQNHGLIYMHIYSELIN